jgi:hypothetical protein
VIVKELSLTLRESAHLNATIEWNAHPMKVCSVSHSGDDQFTVAFELVADPDLVFSTGPAIRAEHLLSNARAEAVHHDPQLSDAIDLMHAVPALAYCAVFVSNDRYMRACSNYVLDRTGRQVAVTSSLSEAVSRF